MSAYDPSALTAQQMAQAQLMERLSSRAPVGVGESGPWKVINVPADDPQLVAVQFSTLLERGYGVMFVHTFTTSYYTQTANGAAVVEGCKPVTQIVAFKGKEGSR